MSTERDPKTGRFKKKEEPLRDPAPDTVTNYVVPISALFLWPIHAGAWVIATVVRVVILAALMALLIAVWGWYVGDPADSCPAVQPARAIVPGSFST